MKDISKLLPGYIDPAIGLGNCGGSEEQFCDVIRIVCKYSDDRKTDICKLFEAEKYDEFLIEVHALKNNFATVGAMEMSKDARELEMACRSGNVDFVRSNGPALLDKYTQLIADLKKALDIVDRESGLIAGDDEISQSFEQIRSCIKKGRFDDASDLFEVLALFNLSDNARGYVDDIRLALINEDGDAVLRILSQIQGGGTINDSIACD